MPWINDGEGNWIWSGGGTPPTTEQYTPSGSPNPYYQAPAGPTTDIGGLSQMLFGTNPTLEQVGLPGQGQGTVLSPEQLQGIADSTGGGKYHGTGWTRETLQQALTSMIPDGEGNMVQAVTGTERQNIENALRMLDQYGVNSVVELPVEAQARLGGNIAFADDTSGSVFKNFITNPGVLLALTAGAGAFGAYGGAAAGGASAAPAVEGYGGLAGGGTAAGGTTGTVSAGTAAGLGEEALGSTGSFGTGANAAAPTGGSPGLGAFTGTPSAAAPAATNTAATAATGTALSRILAGSGTSDDWLAVTGQAAPALLSAAGSAYQAGQYGDLAKQYMAMGQPYRDELARISADPNAFYTSPTATKATESVLQRLSSQYGNPAGNPYAQSLTIDALYDQYGRERDRLAGFGGLTQYAAAAPGASNAAIGAQGAVLGDIGYGIGNVLNPQPSLAQLLRQYGVSAGSV